ncbi:MAG: O-antigen ligase family protein, partial [Ignavibacteriaceae bacterium]
MIKLTPKYASLLLIFSALILISIVAYLEIIKNFYAFLLIINFIPLLLLNNNIHYDLKLELFSLIPLFVLTLLAIGNYILHEDKLSFQMDYLRLPVLLVVVYFGVNAFIAVSGGRNLYWILVEYFHFLLYLAIIPISYLFRERRIYTIVLGSLLIISVLISIEYISYNLFIIGGRFVTFQSGFLPLTIGVVFAYILFNKRKLNRLGAGLVLGVLIAGTFITLTRTLWATTLVVLVITFLAYLKINNRLNWLKTSVLIITLLATSLFLKGSTQHLQNTSAAKQSIGYRTKSISTPFEDPSFLMRVEFSYYALERFLTHPIFGDGLGDYLKYKIVIQSNLRNYYLDNSWFYFLWKGGGVGFLLILWLYFRFLKSAYLLSKHSTDTTVKYISLGLFAGFIGLICLAFLSPLLIKYKTNVLIAFLFAFVEFERMK